MENQKKIGQIQRAKRFLSSRLPISTKKRLLKVLTLGRRRRLTEPQNNTAFPSRAIASDLVNEVFARIRTMPGWMNIDDCAHFVLLMNFQSAVGIYGDILEIGSYHGRSTSVLLWAKRSNERLIICDAFDRGPSDTYRIPPTPERLMANLRFVCPDLDPALIDINSCMSSELDLDPDTRLRFVHIDGGHSKEEALGDLLLSAPYVIPGGIIAVDDYAHPDWPEVTSAVDEFLKRNDEFAVVADLNRHGALGRKIYLSKNRPDRESRVGFIGNRAEI